MDFLSSLLVEKNIGPLVGILLLFPLLTGVLAYILRAQVVRISLVLVTAWTLTIASLLLFGIGATIKRSVGFEPHTAGWGEALMVADFALLAIFVAIGAIRRSALIAGLALLQLIPMAYFEFGMKPQTEVSPAFYVDWLSIIMVLIVSIIGSIVAVYAMPYMREHESHKHLTASKRPRFFAIILVFLGAMNGLVMANNLLWLYFFWEVTTLCSFLLIGHDGTEEALANASRALWMNMLGGVAFVAAIIMLSVGGHGLSVQEIIQNGASSPSHLLMFAMACICFAGFTKSAQMPFQSWLLGAMVAPTPVSALLHSSTMVKAGVYLVVRFAPVFSATHLSHAVALAGSFTFITGALLAIGQSNAKKVLAYSTISNLGLIIACAGLNTPLALAAAVMLILFHAISKGLLFMAVGVVEHIIGSRNIEDMQGLWKRMPLTTFIMVVGILSMLLPPFGVLIAKLAAIEASVLMPDVMLLLVIGSALTVVFWVKWMGSMMIVEPNKVKPVPEKLHSMYFGPLLLLAGGAIIFSLAVVKIFEELVKPAVTQYYAGANNGLPTIMGSESLMRVPWTLMFGAFAMAVFIPLVFFRARPNESRGAYMCGAQVEVDGEVGFVSVADQPTTMNLRSFYFDTSVAEELHTKWITITAIVIICLMFGTGLLPR